MTTLHTPDQVAHIRAIEFTKSEDWRLKRLALLLPKEIFLTLYSFIVPQETYLAFCTERPQREPTIYDGQENTILYGSPYVPCGDGPIGYKCLECGKEYGPTELDDQHTCPDCHMFCDDLFAE